MKRLETLALAVTFALATALPAQAQGLARHTRRSTRSRIVQQPGKSSTRYSSRPATRRKQGFPNHRRPTGTRPQVGGRPGHSLGRRVLGQAFGVDMRAGLGVGVARMNARRYQSGRDRRIAQDRAGRVGYYGTRIGQTIGRMIRP